MSSAPPELSGGAHEWLLAHRRSIFAPWVRAQDAVLEFGPKDRWNLEAVNAARKLTCAPKVDRSSLQNAGVTIFDSLQEVPDGVADLVICYNVLEYELEPRDIIVELKRTLSPTGYLSIHVLYDPAFRNPKLDQVAEHYFSWNVQTLGNLAVDCGFTFVQGGVYRYPREEKILKKAARFKTAALFSRVFDPFEQVHIVARNTA
jgi:SAM-dependent methyltransferase